MSYLPTPPASEGSPASDGCLSPALYPSDASSTSQTSKSRPVHKEAEFETNYSTIGTAFEPTSPNSEQSSVYSDLRLADHEIRLVEVYGGYWEPLRCKLIKHSLKTSPGNHSLKYKALSYAWSTGKEHATVMLGDREVRVSATLYDALHAVRIHHAEELLELRRRRRRTRNIDKMRVRHAEAILTPIEGRRKARGIDHIRVHDAEGIVALRRGRRNAPGIDNFVGVEGPTYLWIDALCIDQSSAAEKSQQVSLMPHIYKMADQVIIWLGNKMTRSEAKKAPPLPFSSSDTLNTTSPASWGYDYEANIFTVLRDLAGGHCLLNIRYFRHKEYWLQLMKALERIMQSPWWFRIWVVQEVILARSAIVKRGSLHISWNQLARAAAKVERCKSGCCANLFETAPSQQTQPLLKFSRMMYDFEEIRGYLETGQEVSLQPLLWRFRSRGASDDRDKVYALLGLVNTWGSSTKLAADYTLPTAEVYVNTVSKMVEVTKSIAILLGNQLKNRHPELPSWVPDFTIRSGFDELDQLMETSRYMASGESQAQITILSGRVLASPGVHIDTVAVVGSIMLYPSSEKGQSTLHAWWKLAIKAFDLKNQPYSNAVGAFWETMCGGRIRLHKRTPQPKNVDGELLQSEEALAERSRRVTASDYDTFFQWVASLKDSKRNRLVEERDREILAVENSVTSTTLMRRFFKTKTGYMGIGPATMTEDDNICVLMGGPAPFVLRPAVPDIPGYTGMGKHWSMVGDCYVHGMMDGEALGLPRENFLLV
ncbi:MAG: hypothetical protein M1822_002785 [Bathelium mastoideum]|nr:MAG: hypothetical protein M1822_002785 [Bathelium mastoideum]